MSITQISKIQVRSGDLADVPQLSTGEFGFATDTKQLFIGNEANTGGILPENTEVLTQYSKIPAAGANTEIQFNNDGVLAAVSSTFLVPTPTGEFSYDYNASLANANIGNGLLTVNDVNVLEEARIGGNLTVVGNHTVNGNVRINGDLEVNGNVTYVNVGDLTVEDPIILLGAISGNGTGNVIGGDRGVLMTAIPFSNTSSNGFMGYVNASNSFTVLTGATTTSNSTYGFVTGNLANFTAGYLLSKKTAASSGNIDAEGYFNGNIKSPGTNTQVIFTDVDSSGVPIMAGANSFAYNKITATVTSNTFVANVGVSSPNLYNASGNLNIISNTAAVNVGTTSVPNVMVVTSSTVSMRQANVAGTANVVGDITGGANANITGNATIGGRLSVVGNANVGNLGTSTGIFTTEVQTPALKPVGSNTSVTVFGNLLPSSNLTWNLGSDTQRWDSLYVGGNTIFIGNTGDSNSKIQSFSANGNMVLTAGQGGALRISGVPSNGIATVTTLQSTFLNGVITVASSSQPNITTLGPLTNLVVTGTANITGTVTSGAISAPSVSATTLTGSLTTASQPNITQVGTLTDLTVSGVIYGNVQGNIIGNFSGALSTSVTFVNDGTGGTSGTSFNGSASRTISWNTIGALPANGQGATGLWNISITGSADSANTVPGSGVTGNVNFATFAYGVDGGNVDGPVDSAILAGTVTTAAQPNITSVGTLTSANVSGTLTAGFLKGDGYQISNIAGGNVTGQVGNALVAGTVYSASQPNITSVGTLTSLSVTGNASVGNLTTTGTITAATFVGNVQGNISGNLTVPGANTQVLFNDSGLAGATADFTFNKTTKVLTVNGNIGGGNVSGIIRPTAGSGTAGIIFPPDPGGGSGDLAVIKYYAYSGESCRLELGVTNDPDDYIYLNATGGTTVTGTLTTTSISSGSATTAGTLTGNWTLTAGSRLEATYADLGERYTSDANYEPGTVVMIGGERETTIATEEGKYRLAGIVSTNPAYVLNSMAEDSVIIALAGRVPCKVVGKISKGDMLTVSHIPGVATSTPPPSSGMVIGRALENYDSESVGVIEVKVDKA